MKRYALCVIPILFLTGCVVMKFHPQLKPLEPSLTYTLGPKTVTSLRPTFKWEASDEPDVTYDFIICEAGDSPGRNLWYKGEPVYYRQGLENTEHAIDSMLLPNRVYLWSVRIRKGEEVQPWSCTNFFAAGPGAHSSGEGWFFPFKTPKMEDVDGSQ